MQTHAGLPLHTEKHIEWLHACIAAWLDVMTQSSMLKIAMGAEACLDDVVLLRSRLANLAGSRKVQSFMNCQIGNVFIILVH